MSSVAAQLAAKERKERKDLFLFRVSLRSIVATVLFNLL